MPEQLVWRLPQRHLQMNTIGKQTVESIPSRAECIVCHGMVEPQKKGTCELASRISKIPNPSIAARPFVTSARGEKAPAQAMSRS